MDKWHLLPILIFNISETSAINSNNHAANSKTNDLCMSFNFFNESLIIFFTIVLILEQCIFAVIYSMQHYHIHVLCLRYVNLNPNTTPCAMAHLIFSLNIQIWINMLFINMFPSGSIKVQSSWVDYEGDEEVNVGTTEPSTGRIGSA